MSSNRTITRIAYCGRRRKARRCGAFSGRCRARRCGTVQVLCNRSCPSGRCREEKGGFAGLSFGRRCPFLRASFRECPSRWSRFSLALISIGKDELKEAGTRSSRAVQRNRFAVGQFRPDQVRLFAEICLWDLPVERSAFRLQIKAQFAFPWAAGRLLYR